LTAASETKITNNAPVAIQRRRFPTISLLCRVTSGSSWSIEFKPTGRGTPSTEVEQAGESRPSSQATPPPFPVRLNSVPGRPPKERLGLHPYTGCDWLESLEHGRRVERSLPGSVGQRRSPRSERHQVPSAVRNEGR